MRELGPLTAADLAPILKRLDALIGLFARVQPPLERATVTDRIRLLGDLGLDNPSIGRIVGRSGNYVTATRGRLRAAAARKKGRKSAKGKGRAARSGRR
jgi:hypothetical protein